MEDNQYQSHTHSPCGRPDSGVHHRSVSDTIKAIGYNPILKLKIMLGADPITNYYNNNKWYISLEQVVSIQSVLYVGVVQTKKNYIGCTIKPKIITNLRNFINFFFFSDLYHK